MAGRQHRELLRRRSQAGAEPVRQQAHAGHLLDAEHRHDQHHQRGDGQHRQPGARTEPVSGRTAARPDAVGGSGRAAGSVVVTLADTACPATRRSRPETRATSRPDARSAGPARRRARRSGRARADLRVMGDPAQEPAPGPTSAAGHAEHDRGGHQRHATEHQQRAGAATAGRPTAPGRRALAGLRPCSARSAWSRPSGRSRSAGRPGSRRPALSPGMVTCPVRKPLSGLSITCPNASECTLACRLLLSLSQLARMVTRLPAWALFGVTSTKVFSPARAGATDIRTNAPTSPTSVSTDESARLIVRIPCMISPQPATTAGTLPWARGPAFPLARGQTRRRCRVGGVSAGAGRPRSRGSGVIGLPVQRGGQDHRARRLAVRGESVDDPLERADRAGGHLQHAARVPGDPVDLQDLRPVGHRRVVQDASRAVAGHPDQRDHGTAGSAQVDVGVVAGDDSGLLQPADPLGDRRWRQVHPPGQLAEGEPRVGLQLAQQRPVHVVHAQTLLS